MKHKSYRILAVLFAVFLTVFAVSAVRTISVYADGEETPDPAATETEAPPTTPEPPTTVTEAPTTVTEAPTTVTEAPTAPEPTTLEPETPEATTTPSQEETTPQGQGETTAPVEHEHQYDAGTVLKEAGCTEDGEIRYTCTVCGNSYTETIPATGHSWGEWVVVTEASYETAGLKERECDNCHTKESEEIPAIGYPEGSVVDVVFTITGGKFADGSTQKNVPVIKYEGGVPSRNGVGHLTAAQIPTDMIPDENYDNGFWGSPEPTTSLDISANMTFAYSYTGNFNYNGTYTSYNGRWRPTTPQGPTQPRPTQPQPTQPTTANPTESEEPSSDHEEEILVVNGEAGSYGELISVGGENFWAYHLPAGTYTVKNEGSDPVTLSVFSDDTITNAEGKEVPAQQFLNLVIPADSAASEYVVFEDGRYVRLSEGSTVRFLFEEDPVESESEETSTEETTSEEETDSASESAEASETETLPSEEDDGKDRPVLVLWPFIVVLSVLLVGLGVLIYFIIRLLKKSGSDEESDEKEDAEEEDKSSDSDEE